MQFATVYSSRGGWWAIYYGMTESGFRKNLQNWSAFAWPSVVRSYQGRFAAVWVDYNWLDSDDCRVELTQSATELGHAIRQLAKHGYLMLRDDVSESTTDNPLTFLQRCQAAAYYLKLARSHGFGFGEFQFLVTPTRAAQLIGGAPLDALQTQDFARSALLSFFRRHLKSEEDGVLDGLATNSPAIARAIRMNGGPVVSTSLNATNIYLGEGLSLSVTATGQDPLTYEWFADGVLLPEVTGDTLTIPTVTTASAAQYTVRVSDANGCTTCSAPITVQPLRFTTQPKDVKAAIGGTASFQVAVQSTEPVTYQWQHNGQNIADATDANLVLSGLQAETIGTYSVRVSGGCRHLYLYRHQQHQREHIVLRHLERAQQMIACCRYRAAPCQETKSLRLRRGDISEH